MSGPAIYFRSEDIATQYGGADACVSVTGFSDSSILSLEAGGLSASVHLLPSQCRELAGALIASANASEQVAA